MYAICWSVSLIIMLLLFSFLYFQGVALDESGHFTGEAEKKLEEVCNFCLILLLPLRLLI